MKSESFNTFFFFDRDFLVSFPMIDGTVGMYCKGYTPHGMKRSIKHQESWAIEGVHHDLEKGRKENFT